MTKVRITSRKPPAVSVGGNRTAATNGNNFNFYDDLPLMRSTNNDDYIDSQFQKPATTIPKKSIALAIFLCCTGLFLIVLGILYLTGYLSQREASDVWPMIIMGLLLFAPGFYHIRIGYYAYKGVPGYSYEDIPEFE